MDFDYFDNGFKDINLTEDDEEKYYTEYNNKNEFILTHNKSFTGNIYTTQLYYDLMN